ncbi:MAG: LURP-one-related/scramblase family protein [Eubacteriales bacterium]
MKLQFRQCFFSWFDSYDICDENGNTVYCVEGQLAWGHCLHILDASGVHVATLREKVPAFFSTFFLYIGDTPAGTVQREFSLFCPRYRVDCRGWSVEGDFFGWDYEILEGERRVASVSKELFRLTDTYTIDVCEPADVLYALMVVLSIDADKCTHSNS